jgi:phosphoribosylglycinamide formyltransferase-1
MRVGVLASGAGTNLQAILDRVHGRHGVEIVAVATDQPGAPALERAARAGVPTAEFPLAPAARDEPAARDRTAHDEPAARERSARDRAIADWLDARGVELVVLAGYMALLDPEFLARFPARVINVHPALLPAFPGLRAIEQALDYGVKVFGVTVHFVDEGVDTGPVIAQRAVELPDATDPAEVREALRPLEHDLLCEAVALIARGAVAIDPARPRRVVVTR